MPLDYSGQKNFLCRQCSGGKIAKSIKAVKNPSSANLCVICFKKIKKSNAVKVSFYYSTNKAAYSCKECNNVYKQFQSPRHSGSNKSSQKGKWKPWKLKQRTKPKPNQPVNPPFYRCLNKACDYVFKWAKGQDPLGNCPHCKRDCCLSCQVQPYHKRKTCSQFQRDTMIEEYCLLCKNHTHYNRKNRDSHYCKIKKEYYCIHCLEYPYHTNLTCAQHKDKGKNVGKDSNLVRCFTDGCRHIFDKRKETEPESHCPVCKKTCCIPCRRQPFHDNQTCQQYQNSPDELVYCRKGHSFSQTLLHKVKKKKDSLKSKCDWGWTRYKPMTYYCYNCRAEPFHEKHTCEEYKKMMRNWKSDPNLQMCLNQNNKSRYGSLDPSKDCKYIFNIQKEESVLTKCPVCYKAQCLSCKVKYHHQFFTCEEYQRLRKRLVYNPQKNFYLDPTFPDFSKCPKEGCDYVFNRKKLLEQEGYKRIKEKRLSCLDCYQSICLKCCVPYHTEYTCEEYLRDQKEIGQWMVEKDIKVHNKPVWSLHYLQATGMRKLLGTNMIDEIEELYQRKKEYWTMSKQKMDAHVNAYKNRLYVTYKAETGTDFKGGSVRQMTITLKQNLRFRIHINDYSNYRYQGTYTMVGDAKNCEITLKKLHERNPQKRNDNVEIFYLKIVNGKLLPGKKMLPILDSNKHLFKVAKMKI